MSTPRLRPARDPRHPPKGPSRPAGHGRLLHGGAHGPVGGLPGRSRRRRGGGAGRTPASPQERVHCAHTGGGGRSDVLRRRRPGPGTRGCVPRGPGRREASSTDRRRGCSARRPGGRCGGAAVPGMPNPPISPRPPVRCPLGGSDADRPVPVCACPRRAAPRVAPGGSRGCLPTSSGPNSQRGRRGEVVRRGAGSGIGARPTGSIRPRHAPGGCGRWRALARSARPASSRQR